MVARTAGRYDALVFSDRPLPPGCAGIEIGAQIPVNIRMDHFHKQIGNGIVGMAAENIVKPVIEFLGPKQVGLLFLCSDDLIQLVIVRIRQQRNAVFQ